MEVVCSAGTLDTEGDTMETSSYGVGGSRKRPLSLVRQDPAIVFRRLIHNT